MSMLARLMLALLVAAPLCPASIIPDRLRCEFRDIASGVDVPRPRVSWIARATEADARDLRQTAYQILVSTSRAALDADRGDLWDSGKVASDRTTLIPYAGKPLVSSATVFWKVRVWDQAGEASPWSVPATWTMGLLKPSDWTARWIGAAPAPSAPAAADGKPAVPADAGTIALRREFPVRPALSRAIIHVTGVGHYELTVNGKKAGEDLLAPGWTDYRKTILYDTRDVTALMRAGGPNVLGIVLGNGMYHVPSVPGRYSKFTGSMGPLQAIAQLELEYADGSVEIIATDARWQVAPGAITFSHVYGGEDFDARLAAPGWDSPGFETASSPRPWTAATVTDGPGGELRGLTHAAPPLRAIEELKPAEPRTLKPGVFVYDLGQNASIIPRISVAGPAGSIVRITPAELLDTDGSVNRRSVGSPPAHWQYTLAGAGGGEAWFPRFFYHGSRYLQVETLPASAGGEPPVVLSLVGVVVHTSSPPAGEFSTSSELINRIRTLIRWAQRSNLVSVITDCPHRERLGWLEQYHLNGPSLRYEFDLAALFAKTFDDMAYAQTPEGLVPDIAPEYTVFKDGFRDSPEWGSAIILAAWQQYQFTGDASAFDRHYGAMQRYIAYLGSKAKNNILGHGLGDWYDLGPKNPGRSQLTPIKLTATAIYYEDLVVLSRIATVLGKSGDAARCAALAAEVRAAFNAALFKPDTRSYATDSQTSNAMPYVLGLVEPEHAPAVLDAIVRDVRSRGDAITAGDVGYRYLLRALADGGRSDVVYAMNNQSAKPGYGYQLAKGATSLTEAWNSDPASSQNHFMLGQIMEWFYHDLAGIRPDAAAPGFRKFVIKPAIVGDLGWVKASYDSPQGRITSAWKREGNRVTIEVAVPANTTATIHVPTSAADRITESGGPVAQAKGLRALPAQAGYAVFAAGSGRYAFTSEFAPAPSGPIAP